MYFPTFPHILLDTNPMALSSAYKQMALESPLQLRLLTPAQAHM